MSARMVLLLLAGLGVLVAGCGGSGPQGTPPPSGGDDAQTTFEVGPLLIHTAAAPGFVAEDIPNPGGGVSLVGLYGSRMDWMASRAMLDRIVFASDRAGGVYNVWVCNLDGSGAVQLTDNTATELAPCWSPDGASIAFQRMWPALDWEIMMMNANGASVSALTDNAAIDEHPSFAPEGRRLAFHSNRTGNMEIFAMYTNGSGATNLTNHGALDTQPDWSPDLSDPTILFSTLRDGNLEIYEMESDGSSPTRMTDNTVIDQHPDYHPTRSRMAMQTSMHGNVEVALVNLGAAAIENFSATPGEQGRPSWSTDGRFICYASSLGSDYELVLQEAEPPYAKYALTQNGAQELDPNLGSQTLQTDRVIIGPAGSDWGGNDPVWTSAYGGIAMYGAPGGGGVSMLVTAAAQATTYRGFVRIGVAPADADTLSISPVAPAAPVVIGRGYGVVGVLVEAREIVNLREDGGRGREPIAWALGSPGPTALVIYFNSITGEVISVMALRDSAYPASAGSPAAAVTQRVDDGATVVEGDFAAVYDATGARIADAASEVSITEGAVNVVR